jgi:hypothetical protein
MSYFTIASPETRLRKPLETQRLKTIVNLA